MAWWGAWITDCGMASAQNLARLHQIGRPIIGAPKFGSALLLLFTRN
jgi:hypothetical protein